ncbi:HEXXH motif-containing putative peptide modification protein [Streptomyces sp. NPDC059037]|uniref:aKG-HExxH-type peptide beta-hydroxylase n=1 Tax=Streptomyces sp. NPDC059037 TaxID=3346710 RepID=UPI0036A414BA
MTVTVQPLDGQPLDVHRVSRESLRAIAAGRADEADLMMLRSGQRSQLLLVLRALLDHVDDAARGVWRPGGVPSGQEAWHLLCAAQRQSPEAVETVLTDPAVMAWALRLLRRLGGSAATADSSAPLWADLGQFQAVAAAAALRAGVRAVLRVPAHRGMVWVPGAGVAGPVARRRWSAAEVRVERDGAIVLGELARVRLPRPPPAAAPGWRPLRTLSGCAPRAHGAAGPWLDTVTPYRDFTRYPKSPGRSGERRLRLWEDRLAGAYALLDRESPADAAALRGLVRVLVPRPFRTARGGLVASASSVDAFGSITLSLPYDVTQTAAVLVHETRHQQLNALLGLVPLVQADEDRRGGPEGWRRLYYAPWRSDPRPALGLLHGVFAFAGVARFWRRHRAQVTGVEAQRADFEFAVLREQVREAVAALAADGDLTEAGRLFIDEIAAAVREWQEDDVLAVPGQLARDYCALRRAVWRARHLEVARSAAERCAAAWSAGRQAPALPSATLRPRPDLIRLDTFGPLARYRLSAPDLFARGRRQAEASGDPARLAEYAAIARDAEQAALGYAEWTTRDPQDAEAWIGAALALPREARGAGFAVLLNRPEAVAGVRRAVAAARGGFPDPMRLAAWLADADASGAEDSPVHAWPVPDAPA